MKRALVVIDAQQEYLSGPLRIAYPAVDEAVARIVEATDAATAAGVPVALVQQVAPHGAPVFAEGSAGAGLIPAVGSRPHATVITKQLPGSFTGTRLGAWVEQQHIDTLTLVGFMTHNCVDTTARQAVHRGLGVEVLSDAVGTVGLRNELGAVSAEELQRACLVVLQARFAAVTSTADWVRALSDGNPPRGSNLLASVDSATA
jgi:nicotinamidase-related amidase